jgi:crotonobetainyl-CoA:carnitine CoA-transferase CaiB-like acyl-CoA transferase
MHKEGFSDDFLQSIDWSNFDMVRLDQETWNHIEALIGKFFLNHTKEELYREGVNRSLMIYPVYTPKDIAEDKQLEARKYWISVEYPELGDTLTYPGAAAKTPLMSPIKKRAPLIGEHNQEIYQELGFTEHELSNLKGAGVI